MKNLFLILFFCVTWADFSAYAQHELAKKDSIVIGGTKVDSLYREDQFYVGFGFNLLINKPKGISQSGFSGGLHLGFIRDMPLNKQRDWALGAGLGWSINSYGVNLLISENAEGKSIFNALDNHADYDTNRFSTYLIEAPIQLRWRTSTPTSYKFWRIYTGFRLGYVYYFRSTYKSPDLAITQTKVDELNRFRFGATFTFGYNTFNFHVYYSLNQFFDGKLAGSGAQVGLNTFKIGLMFYIL